MSTTTTTTAKPSLLQQISHITSEASSSTSIIENKSSRHHRHHRGHFYVTPVPHNIRHGDEHPPLPHVWVTVFYDLAIVACFQQAHLCLSTGILQDRVLDSIALFIACVSITTHFFFTKMSYNCRFETKDMVHRFVEILQAGIVAVAGLSIAPITVAEVPGSGHAFALSLSCVIFTSIDLLLTLEIYFLSNKPIAKGFARAQLLRQTLPILVALASLVAQLCHAPFALVATCWFLIHCIGLIEIFITLFFRRMSRIQIPMHVEFSIKRLNELFMLAFGECVIEIVSVTQVNRDNDTFVLAFGSSYVQIAFVALSYYTVIPREPDEHVMRRNGLRSIVNFLLMPLFVGCVLAFAAGLSFELQYRAQGTWLLCYALGFTLLFITFTRILHIGFRTEFMVIAAGRRVLKLVFVFAKLAITGIVIGVSASTSLQQDKAGLSLVLAACTAMYFIISAVDMRIFNGQFLQLVDEEVEERRRQRQQKAQEEEKNNSNVGGETNVPVAVVAVTAEETNKNEAEL